MTAFINTPAFKALIGLVIFYIGLKTFAGGVKSMGNSEDLQSFIANPYWMFIGGIVCTLLWQSSSLSTTIWLAGFFVSDGMPTGATRQIAMIHTGVNTLMSIILLPFVQPIARFVGKF